MYAWGMAPPSGVGLSLAQDEPRLRQAVSSVDAYWDRAGNCMDLDGLHVLFVHIL